jgi:hypothetical protein
VQTGFYGAVLDVSDGNLDTFGLLDLEVSPEDALMQDSARIAALPAASVHYAAATDGLDHLATGFAGTGADVANPSQVIDMGRFMQRVEIPEVTYSGDATLAGSVQLAAMTAHLR